MKTIRLLVCAAALVVALATVAPASAGTYTTGYCALDASSQTSIGASTTATQGSDASLPYWWASNECSTYYYVRFEENTLPNGASYDFSFGAPTDTYISNLTWQIDASAHVPGAGNGVYAIDQNNNTLTAIAIGNGGSFSNGSASYSAVQGVKGARVSEFCNNPSGCTWPGGAAYSDDMYFHGLQLTLVDAYNPAFAATGGSGWTATPADSATDSVTYSLTDRGSGVKSVDLYVDGTKKATNAITCSRSTVPCPLTKAGSFTLDTTQLSEGDHALKMTVTDFSGNTTDATQTVTIRRKPIVAPDPDPATPGNANDPSIGGVTVPFTQGETATGDRGTWTGTDITYSYQWQRCDPNGQGCTDIPGATNLTYTAGAGDVGHTLVFCVTGTSTGGTTTQCSQPSPLVQADADGDGVPDALDACPSTAAATANGCPAPVTTVDPPSDPKPQPTDGSSATNSTGNATGGHGAANGSNATEAARLTALISSRSLTMRVGYGKKVRITGRLVTPTGEVIAGARLTVARKLAAAGAALTDSGSVTTDSDGKFVYVAAAGPSRTIRFAYKAFANDTSFASTTDVTLLVKGSLTLKAPKAVKNRKKARFAGKLKGGYVPKGGVLVDLQVFFHRQWRTFATPRTNARGAYKFKYRFTQGAAKWLFRARIRKDSAFPFEVNYSAKRAVKVTR